MAPMPHAFDFTHTNSERPLDAEVSTVGGGRRSGSLGDGRAGYLG